MKIRIMFLVLALPLMLLCGCMKPFTDTPPITDTPPNESRPDLIPIEIVYDELNLSIGQSIYFDSGIRNEGFADSEGFNIKWFVNGEQLGYGGHPGIPTGVLDKDNNSQFSWNPTQAGTYLIEFVVDCDLNISESNENNNTASVTVEIQQYESVDEEEKLPEIEGSDLQDSSDYVDEDKQWPEIEGLSFKDNSYYYERGNPYGQQTGDLAGIVNPQVVVNGVQVGGVCLDSPVCLILLNKAIDNLVSIDEKLKVVMPIDISNYTGTVEIDDTVFINPSNVPVKVISIECDGTVPIRNITLAKALSVWQYRQIGGKMLRAVCNPRAFEKLDENNLFDNIVIISTGTDLLEDVEGVDYEYENTYYGSFLVTKEQGSILYLTFASKEMNPDLTVTTDNLLKTDGIPVFIADYE